MNINENNPLRPLRSLRFTFTLLLAFLAVSACGWRLQGAYTFPPQMARTYIQAADEYSPLVMDLRRALENSAQVTVVAAPEEATAVLRIAADQAGKRVLSVDASSRAREYEAYYRVVYSLQAAEGTTLLPEQERVLTRQYLYDENDILAKSREAELLQENMQQDMVRLILRRLAAAGNGLNNARP